MPASTAAADLETVTMDAAPSRLSERIATHPDAARAFAVARERFLAGDRIDMSSLAAELGVVRTSLFRWVGNRDELLSEILWSLALPTILRADRATVHLRGTRRVVELFAGFVADITTAPYFQEFLRREPARALRLITTNASEIQRRHIAAAVWLIRRELGEAPLGGAIDPETLAYLLVRVTESFAYSDLIAGEAPSVERARAALGVILREG